MCERLYFLHIPKTGGTALFEWLRGHFAPAEVCPAVEPERLLARSRGSLDRYRLFGWHYGLHLLRLFDEPPRIVTVLRDPLSRSISHYRDICSRPGHPLYGRVRGLSFEQFVMSAEGEAELLNLQCRFLALDDYDGDFLWHQRAAASDPVALGEKYRDPAMLARAERRLESLAVVGLCEQLDDVAERVAGLMGWPAPGPLPRLNAAQSPFPCDWLTAAAAERVRELTVFDQTLYARVVLSLGCRTAIPTHITS